MELLVVAHNIRSALNVGAIFRCCDGFGVRKLYLSGYSPYPSSPDDDRLPHVRRRLHAQIHKTALGAETSVDHEHAENAPALLRKLKADGFTVVGLEQTAASHDLRSFRPPAKCALVLGEEVGGIPIEVLAECEQFVDIPMQGKKESFNVAVAAGIALYALTS